MANVSVTDLGDLTHINNSKSNELLVFVQLFTQIKISSVFISSDMIKTSLEDGGYNAVNLPSNFPIHLEHWRRYQEKKYRSRPWDRPNNS